MSFKVKNRFLKRRVIYLSFNLYILLLVRQFTSSFAFIRLYSISRKCLNYLFFIQTLFLISIISFQSHKHFYLCDLGIKSILVCLFELCFEGFESLLAEFEEYVIGLVKCLSGAVVSSQL